MVLQRDQIPSMPAPYPSKLPWHSLRRVLVCSSASALTAANYEEIVAIVFKYIELLKERNCFDGDSDIRDPRTILSYMGRTSYDGRSHFPFLRERSARRVLFLYC